MENDKSTSSQPLSMDSMTILLIEDNEDDAVFLMELLAQTDPSEKFRLIHCRSLSDGLSESDGTHADMILLDLGLPECSGLESLHRVLAVYTEIPIVVLSGLADKSTAIEAMREGAQDYLVKGQIQSESLWRCIHYAFERHRLKNQIKQHAKKAQAAEERFRSLIELNVDGMVILDADNRIRLANRAAEHFFGSPADTLVGRPFDYSGFSSERNEISFNPPGGEVVAECRSAPISWEGDEASLISIRDITERKRAQDALERLNTELNTRVRQRTAELAEAEEILRNAFDFSPIGMALAAESGRFLNLNAELCRILGYAKEELLTKTFQEIIHPDDCEANLSNMRQMLAGEIGSCDVKTRCLHKDGSLVWAQLNASLARDSSGQPLFFIAQIQDITGRKRAEEERQKLQAQLNQAQKMESVGRLAGGVAHDFNNMLTIINGYAEMMADVLPASDPMHESAREIHDAGKRSAVIVRKLLAFARKQAISPVAMNLNDNISAMLKMLQRLIGENIDLRWKPSKDIWLIKMDFSQIDQILANLVVNARDAFHEGGVVTIETKNAEFDKDYCAAHPGFVQGQYVMLAVSDNGCGMSKEVQAHLFEPFFTTKEVGKGTGLGLATVYGIVKQNNGFVNVYSEPGEGTSFKVYFPRYKGDEKLEGSEDEEKSPLKANGEKILILEDEEEVLGLARLMLEKLGYHVLAAQTPDKAMSLAEAHAGQIDLLITDVVMPEINGRDFASQLKTLYPDVKVMFMSGYTANAIARRTVMDEGKNFIQKPFALKDLAVKVREVIDGG
ncbi:MAG: PAS domain S-box protein [Desulfosalsimonas sp.]